MVERLTGSEAYLLHVEKTTAPMHTLKVVILDAARLGRPLELSDVRQAVESHLGYYPRLCQRVIAAPLFKGRPFWVTDAHFDIDRHLHERALPGKGSMVEFDAVCSELATGHLDRLHPLWDMTLVDGLPDGRQAVIVRIHHAIADGTAAVNSLLAFTSDRPGGPISAVPAAGALDPPVSRLGLLGLAVAEVGPWLAGFVRLVRSSRANAKKVKEFRARAEHLPPPGLSAYRDFTLAPFGDRRVCATASLPLEDFRTVRRAFDVTINGVVHAVVAGALRRELLARGDDTGAPHIASFGISVDQDETRLWGNRVTSTFVSLYNDIEDPVERLRQTAASCREGVELRQVTGLEMVGKWIDYAARLAPLFNRVLAFRTNMANHVCTANVAGPPATRWLGPVEVVDWYSFAVVVPAISSNIVFYSYAGKMNIGLLVAPEDFPQPYRFLDEIRDSLTELLPLAHEALSQSYTALPTGSAPR